MGFPAIYYSKIKALGYWVAFLIFIIITRLIYLQLLNNNNFFALGIKNFMRTETIACPRGNILDSNKSLLATNRPVTCLYWQGTGELLSPEMYSSQIKALKEIIGPLDEQKIVAAQRMGTKIMLAEDIPFDQLSKIMERYPNNPRLVVAHQFKRFYPHNKVACHILGHLNTLNNLETIGKMGLEKIVHDTLQGQPGALLKTINSIGRKIDQIQIKTPLAGKDIITTLDLPLQLIAESLFPKEHRGTLIVMDPRTGSIRALVSRPDFDPALFLDPLSNPEWELLQQGQPFLNRAFNACYPPASIFKLITVSAALEKNLITPHDSVYCSGYYRFKGRRHYCMRRTGHGQLSIRDSLAKSCNILFYQIATQLSIDCLAEYAYKFGLGKKTGLLFAEKEGLVPSIAWKHSEKRERWWPGETLSCSIGQSYLLVTPIQIACMISSIFEGYLVTPRILENEIIQKRPLEIQESTRNFLKKSTKSVVRVGTGQDISQIEDMTVHAKTGTAQIAKLGNKNPQEALAHAWFVVYFYYKNHDPLTMVILLENTGNTKASRALAKNYLKYYRAYMKSKEIDPA